MGTPGSAVHPPGTTIERVGISCRQVWSEKKQAKRVRERETSQKDRETERQSERRSKSERDREWEWKAGSERESRLE